MLRWILILIVGCGVLRAADAPWKELAEASRLAVDDPAAAQTALEALVLEHPEFAPARFNLGTLLLASDANRAAEHLEFATQYPGTALAADAWHNLALARWKQGRLEPALQAADQALTLRLDEKDFLVTRDELRRAWLAQEDALRLKREAEARRLRLADTPLKNAQEGDAYQFAITALGGTPGYQFTVEGLPAGLAADAEGVVSGTPAANTRGEHALTLTITDQAKGSIREERTLTVLPPPAITTETLPEGLVGVPYEAQLASEGVTNPRWSATGLPAGITLDSQGILRGTPTVAGNSTVSLQVADEKHQAQRDVPLTVLDSFAPAESRLPPATAWAPYQHQLSIRGPTQTYSWQQSAPTGGVTIASDGSVGGSPDQAGELPLPVEIKAADGRSRRVEMVLPVNPPPVIACEERLTVQRQRLLNRPLKVEGGTPPYRWSSTGGPVGVRVDPDGSLRGAANTLGETEMVISLQDRWNASAQITVTVVVEEPKDDQQQDQQQDQQNQDQQGQENLDPQNQDQQNPNQKNPNQAGQDQKPKQDPADQKNPNQQAEDQNPADQDPHGLESQQSDQKPATKPGSDQSENGDKRPGEEPDDANNGAKNGAPPPPEPKPGKEPTPLNRERDKPPGEAKPGTGEPDSGEQTGTGAAATLDLSREAADRWLESLPAEDRDTLRLQLLQGQRPAPSSTKEPW